MAQKPDKDQYSEVESQKRFEAALRGSREVGPRPMKDAGKRDQKSKSREGNNRPKGKG